MAAGTSDMQISESSLVWQQALMCLLSTLLPHYCTLRTRTGLGHLATSYCKGYNVSFVRVEVGVDLIAVLRTCSWPET